MPLGQFDDIAFAIFYHHFRINGLEGYIVAEEGDVLLICKKSDSSSLIRKYVNEVGIRYGEEFI